MMDNRDLNHFLKMFDIRNSRAVNLYQPPRCDITPFNEKISDKPDVLSEPAYQFTISERQLKRLIQVLKDKGYYHDEDYTKRLNEEDLILENPELKRMHDQYKMYLYMLCGDEWRDHAT